MSNYKDAITELMVLIGIPLCMREGEQMNQTKFIDGYGRCDMCGTILYEDYAVVFCRKKVILCKKCHKFLDKEQGKDE